MNVEVLSHDIQGVLVSKFPISIQTQTRQKIRKIPKQHVPVSDFATRPLNLRKPQKPQKFCKEFFFSLKNAIQDQRRTFSGYLIFVL